MKTDEIRMLERFMGELVVAYEGDPYSNLFRFLWSGRRIGRDHVEEIS